MAINTGAFIGVFFLGPGDTLIYGILVFISGIGFGATLAIPLAIQADVIDYDELISGERTRRAIYRFAADRQKNGGGRRCRHRPSVLGLARISPC